MVKRSALLGWCWLAGLSPAFAADLDLGSMEQEVDALLQRAGALRQQVDPSATGDARDADERYQDALFAFLTRDYDEAARRFWLLRMSGMVEDATKKIDLDWYLAQSLAEADMPGLAIELLDEMVADRQHPYRTGAVRTLLDLYVDLGQADDFDRLYQREVVSGNIAITDATRFDVGRVLLRQGDGEGAASYLAQIEPGSPFWYRAAYHLGAIAVKRGTEADLDEALATFTRITEAAEASPPTEEADLAVVDLAWLGRARVHQARSELADALGAYTRVRDDSEYRLQQLHELVWTFARVGRWDQAEVAVELFVLTYPDHPWAAEMRLTRGHLAYREGREEEAMLKYSDVVESLDPVSERFADLLASRSETARTLDALAASEDGEIGALPPYAVSLVVKDAEFNRAVGVYAELQAEDAALTAAEGARDRIAAALGEGSTVEGDEVLPVRRGVVESMLAAVGLRLQALDAEARWLRALGGTESDRLANLASQRMKLADRHEALASRVTNLDTPSDVAAAESTLFTDLPDIDATLRTMAQTQRVERVGLGVDLKFDPSSARVDGMHSRLDALMDSLVRLSKRTPTMTQSAVADLMAQYRDEVRNVRGARRDWVALSADAREVGVDAGQSAFANAKDEVDDTIMGAEMGIVNIYWSRWVESGEEAERVKNERAALLDALEDRYGLIRQTFGR